ncbi:MAG: Hsp70 family protein [Fimbriimonadaceae bacterium]|nr:Hsp70 family protein [Fimbriimonadaceae bacterium]
MSSAVGIDFGTTNSVVARLVAEPLRTRLEVVRSSFGEDRIPSAVAVDRGGRWLFGRAAREADALEQVLSVKRLLGSATAVTLGGALRSPEAVATLLFRHLVQEAGAHLGEPLAEAVVTVPANSKGLQRQATKAAAAAAGLRVVNLINEPTAAAMAYGLGGAAAGDDRRVLVYDLGGGTFDLTVLRTHHGLFEELASRGLQRCGGDDLDQSLAAWLVSRHLPRHQAALAAPQPALRLRLAAEAAKIRLTEQEQTRIDVEDLLPGVSLHAELDRAALEQLASPLLQRTAEPLRAVLSDARLLPSDLDQVLLVGGSSLMPAVRRFVEQTLGRAAEPFERAEPLTCVAQGAAIVAGILQRLPPLADLDYQVCLEHALCMEPVDPLTGQRYLDPIIPRGTKIPCRNTKRFFPVADFSAAVVVGVWEGNQLDQPTHEENVRLGELRVPLDPRRPAEQCPIDVEFSYSEDGLLTASAHDTAAERTYREVVDHPRSLDDPAVAAQLRELQVRVFGSPPRELLPPAAEHPAEPAGRPATALGPDAERRLAQADVVLQRAAASETGLLRELAAALTAAAASGAGPAELAEHDRRLAAELMFFDYLF